MKKLVYITFLLSLILWSSCSGFVTNDTVIGNYGLVAVDDEKEMSLCYFEPTDKNGGCVPVVNATVFSVGHNKDYIITKQHPNNNKQITNYFILPTLSDKKGDFGLLGPYNFLEFEKKRKELNIASIKFDIIYKDLE